jgi:hypothetical protein
MLARGRVSAGEVGSSNAAWADQRAWCLRDEHGFAYHRLVSEPTAKPLAITL